MARARMCFVCVEREKNVIKNDEQVSVLSHMDNIESYQNIKHIKRERTKKHFAVWYGKSINRAI